MCIIGNVIASLITKTKLLLILSDFQEGSIHSVYTLGKEIIIILEYMEEDSFQAPCILKLRPCLFLELSIWYF